MIFAAVYQAFRHDGDDPTSHGVEYGQLALEEQNSHYVGEAVVRPRADERDREWGGHGGGCDRARRRGRRGRRARPAEKQVRATSSLLCFPSFSRAPIKAGIGVACAHCMELTRGCGQADHDLRLQGRAELDGHRVGRDRRRGQADHPRGLARDHARRHLRLRRTSLSLFLSPSLVICAFWSRCGTLTPP